jgi:ubiquinone/menaquinone biosynthesis C-methylase UbiE
MKKPIDKVSFWEERLTEAREEGDLRSSVFRGGDWATIDQAHKSVLQGIIGPLDSVLDAGCGYGRARQLIPCNKYVGVDQCLVFIRKARQDLGLGGENDSLMFEVGNLSSLRFTDNYFDWSVGISLMVMVIQNLGWDKWDKIQTELLRVSKHGVICLEYTDPEIYYLIRK